MSMGFEDFLKHCITLSKIQDSTHNRVLYELCFSSPLWDSDERLFSMNFIFKGMSKFRLTVLHIRMAYKYQDLLKDILKLSSNDFNMVSEVFKVDA
jgi:hypothetical protein